MAIILPNCDIIKLQVVNENVFYQMDYSINKLYVSHKTTIPYPIYQTHVGIMEEI